MLSKNENLVMAAVYSLCDGTEGCLVSPLDIMSVLPAKHKITLQSLDDILSALRCDGRAKKCTLLTLKRAVLRTNERRNSVSAI